MANRTLYCHKSILSPPATPPRHYQRKAGVSAAPRALTSPGPGQPHAATLTHPFRGSQCGSPGVWGRGRAPGVPLVPRAREEHRVCLPCKVPGHSSAIMGPRWLSGADCSAGPNQGTLSRICSGGGEEIAGKGTRPWGCLPFGATAPLGGGGGWRAWCPALALGRWGWGGQGTEPGRWTLERCPLHPSSNV